MSRAPSLDEIKAAANARPYDVLAALGIRERVRLGGYIHMCNPVEKDRHPSFTIWPEKGGVLTFKDHRGIAQGDIIDLVAYLKGWSNGPKKGRREALRWLADICGLARLSDEQRRADASRSIARVRIEEKRAAEDLAKKQMRAWEMFRHAVAQQSGSIADRYLKARGIDLEALPRGPRGGIRWPHAIRSEISRHLESGLDMPCMIAACTDCATIQVLAVHRTWLRGDCAAKADMVPNRKVWPDFRGLIIPLWRGESRLSVREAAAVGLRETLQLAEGIETGLSMVIAEPAFRTWAFISLSNLQNVALPECCDSVLLSRENEWSNPAALASFDRGIAALRRQGRPIEEVSAPVGKDLNDTLRGAA